MSLASGQVLRSDHINNILRALKEATSVISGLAVEPTSPPSMNVIVRSGVGVIQGSVVSVASDTTVAISTPHTSYPRFDLITLKSTGVIGYYVGTPEPALAVDLTKPETYVKPKPPTTPAGELALAEVFVPAGATAIDKIIDRRIVTASMATQQVTLAPLTADPTLVAGKMWYRSDLSRIRYSPDGTSVISLDPPLTAADVWTYSDRTLTQAKFPFWSAIITQQASYYTIGALTGGGMILQPPSGETWLVNINFYLDDETSGSYDVYQKGGSNMYMQKIGGNYGCLRASIAVQHILTNTNYATLYTYNASSSAKNVYYGYSGFKLSQPLWEPKRLNSLAPKPWKKPTTLALPDPIKPLDKYKAEILGLDPAKPEEYSLGIILEEDTPLAVDPETNFPVERLTLAVRADVLADFIAKFKTGKADPVTTGYAKYLKKWKDEGIDFGIPGV
jgi:hypothetical protein